MHAAGAFLVAGRLVIRIDDLDAFERARSAAARHTSAGPPDEIRTAVSEILGEPAFATRARQRRAAIPDADGAAAACNALEILIR